VTSVTGRLVPALACFQAILQAYPPLFLRCPSRRSASRAVLAARDKDVLGVPYQPQGLADVPSGC